MEMFPMPEECAKPIKRKAQYDPTKRLATVRAETNPSCQCHFSFHTYQERVSVFQTQKNDKRPCTFTANPEP